MPHAVCKSLQFHTSELENPTLPTTRWGLTLDNIHRVIPLQTEDGLAVFESLAVHPAGRLLATPTANGIALSDLWTGRRLGFLSAPGVCRVARFDLFGNLFAARDDRSRVAGLPVGSQGDKKWLHRWRPDALG